MKSRMTNLLLGLSWLAFLQEGHCGTVTTLPSYPDTAMSQYGDWIAAGNRKVLVNWGSRFYGLPLEGVQPTFRFTSGIADQDSYKGFGPQAIACSMGKVVLFNTSSTDEPLQASPHEQKVEPVQCAMLPSGDYVIYWPRQNKVAINSLTEKIELPIERPFMSFLVGTKFEFLILGTNGKGLRIKPDSNISLFKHPFKSIDSYDRYQSNGKTILRASDFKVTLAAISRKDDSFLIEKPKDVGISPCAEKTLCSASIAEDGSIAVIGYWGAYIGTPDYIASLKLRSLPEKYAGSAFSHSSINGKFVYISSFDDDFGSISELEIKSLGTIPFTTNQMEQSKRWFVWPKRSTKRGTKILTAYPDLSGRAQEIRFLKGGLPINWQKDFHLVEPEQHIRIPDKVESSGELVNLTWYDFLGRDETWELLHQSPIIPKPVTVAVVDTGIDPHHPWIKDKLWRNLQEIPNNGIDDDNNGFVDDVHGFDFHQERADLSDPNGHGTHVSGLVAAENAGQRLGSGTNAEIMALRAFDPAGLAGTIDIARALAYALDKGVDIVNCSWGGGINSLALETIFERLDQRQIQVIASSGNASINLDRNDQVPTRYPGVIGVASLLKPNKISDFSNFGRTTVEFATMGEDIRSIYPDSSFYELSGTSMSSGIASGAYAILLGVLKSTSPYMSRVQQRNTVMQSLCAHAQPIRQTSCGQMNLLNSMKHLMAF